jgi:diguanylate cyclase
MKILIVDDNEIDLALIKRELSSSSQYCYDVKEAGSVAQGLEILETEVFDVILLDYKMPEANGIEMIIEIRSRPLLGNTAIVIISASQEITVALECIEAGAQDFVAKSDIRGIKLHQAMVHARKRFEMEQDMQKSYLALKTIAERDQLTGLFNRHYFDENLKFMIANSDRLGLSVGMLALDIDNFKHINDSMGHQAGDQLLIAVVSRVSESLRVNDGFARLGGDEFAITLSNVHTVDEVNMIANRILNSFSEDFIIDGKHLNCSVSIGAAVYSNDAKSREDLVKCADIAMYRAKQSGKNTLRFYEPSYQFEFNRRFVIQNDINEVLKHATFRLFYQPVLCAHSDRIKGVEALIRWPEAEKSYSPDEFIPVAEETRLIHDIGKWVIVQAIADLASWQKRYDKQFTVAINVSPLQLQDVQLLQLLNSETQKHGIQPATITIEVTETALLEDDDLTRSTLNALAHKGYKIALDDFGVGFSSISHLNSYPINIVKLDKSLQSIDNNTGQHKNVLEAVALMLKRLDFLVVAEGIETQAQLAVCQNLNIDWFQGYLLGRQGRQIH